MNIIVSAMSIIADALVIIVALLLIIALLEDGLGKRSRAMMMEHRVRHFNTMHENPLSKDEEDELIQYLTRSSKTKQPERR